MDLTINNDCDVAGSLCKLPVLFLLHGLCHAFFHISQLCNTIIKYLGQITYKDKKAYLTYSLEVQIQEWQTCHDEAAGSDGASCGSGPMT